MNTATQSPLLTQFYNDLDTWISNGCPKYTDCFYPTVGLCSNLIQWIIHNKLNLSTHAALEKEMKDQFIAAGLNELLPFNQWSTYSTEEKYKNPKRLEWIKSHSTNGDIS